MSRNYDLTVRIKGINQEDISAFLEQHYGVFMDVVPEGTKDDVYTASGIVTLYAGQSDFEAHEEIAQHFKAINQDALVQTQWTYLENLPFEEYGDNFSGDEDE